MKKIFLLVVAMVAFSSCEEEVKFNNPSLQVMKDDELLRVDNPHVLLNLDGTVSITGEYGFEVLSLKVPSTEPGTYYFGLNNNTVAYYKYEADDGLVLEYSTIAGVENSDYEENLGELTIYDISNPKSSPMSGTISGEFKFRGRIMNDNPFGQPSIFFHQGHFYNLAIQGVEGNQDEIEIEIDIEP